MSDNKISRWMSRVLRHDPAAAGLTLDDQGWTSVDRLIAACPLPLDRALLDRLVADNPKQRFAFSEDGTRIRAQQGHSVPVDLGLAQAAPPDVLYHGTAASSLASITAEGLRRGARHHVHLSPDADTAHAVGRRHGPPVILTVEAGRMARDGHVFFRSGNGVWLTDHVPPGYLSTL